MNAKEGDLGSSSFGETRLWRNAHHQTFKNEMMLEALEMWKELEEETGQQLIIDANDISKNKKYEYTVNFIVILIQMQNLC